MNTGHPARATCCCCYGISEFLVVAVTHHHEPSGLNSTRLPSELEDGSLQAASLRWGAVVSRAGSSGGLREGHIPSLPASGGCLRSWALALPPSPERVPSVLRVTVAWPSLPAVTPPASLLLPAVLHHSCTWRGFLLFGCS